MNLKKIALACFIPTLLLNNAAFSAQTQKPNILLIVADDLGFSDIEPFGGEIHTPNLKKLAKQGAVLSNFYAGPTCSVTRSMLLTGNDNHQAGIGSMSEFLQPEQKGKPGYEGRLNDKVITIAEILKQNGYATFMTGKWHLGGTPESIPSARGFFDSFALLQGGAAHFDASPMFPGNYKTRYLNNGKEVKLTEQFYSSDFYTDQMISYLKNNRKKNQPFFAYLAYTAPHWPLQAPDQYLKKYEHAYTEGYDKVREARFKKLIKLGVIPANAKINDPLLGVFKNWNQLDARQKAEQIKTMQVYAAMIDNLDHNIGRVLNYLQSTKDLDNTLILFMSDNGAESASPESLGTTEDKNGIADWVNQNFDNRLEHMGKKGSYVTLGPQWAQVASTPLPYFKSFLADGGIHVPAIIRYPKLVKANSIQKNMLHVSDFAPTILELTQTTRPTTYNNQTLIPMQGQSFASVFKEKTIPERAIGWEFNNKKSLYKGDWTIRFEEQPYGTGQWELYNRKDDPTLKNSIATQHPDKLNELIKDWDAYAQRVGVVSAPVRYRYGQMNCFYGKCIGPEEIKNLSNP